MRDPARFPLVADRAWNVLVGSVAPLFVVLLSSVVGVSGVSAQELDVSGTWSLEVQTDQGGGSPTVTLQQQGSRITGRYRSELLGDADVTGTVEGSRLTFRIRVNAQGTPLTVTYTGELEEDSISGDFDLGGLASGSFTGTRQ